MFQRLSLLVAVLSIAIVSVSSQSAYLFATPYLHSINGTLAATTGSSSSAAALYYYIDVPANAYFLTVSVTVMEATADRAGTLAALLRRGAPFVGTHSAGDLGQCNETLAALPQFQEYACMATAVSSSATSISAKQLRVVQPRAGRYFLTLQSVSGTAEFLVSVNFQTCDTARQEAPDFDGTCQPVSPLLDTRTVGFLAPSETDYFYILPSQQPTGSSAANLVALALNFSATSCTDGLIYLRQGGMPDLAGSSSDVVVPCAAPREPLLWLYPSSAQIYFVGMFGGSGGISYDFTISPVFAYDLCKNYKATGVRCSASLTDASLCPPADLVSCEDSFAALPAVASQSSSVVLSSNKWSVVSVKTSDNLFSLTVKLSSPSDQKSTLISGETWEAIAHFDTSPDLLISSPQLGGLYPFQAKHELALPIDPKTPLLTLDVPYPQSGTWYIALRRVVPGSPFGQPDPAPKTTLSTLTIQQNLCPNSCSGHGSCQASSRSCECRAGFQDIDCSVVNNTKSIRTGGDGLIVGLSFTLPVLLVLFGLAIGFVWWKESKAQSEVEML